jgi:transcriptional regulator with XRE-family HTH domain
MSTRPSEAVLRMLREQASLKGLNTAALARAAGLDRAHLKHVLAGSVPLTVDDLAALATAMELGPAELGAAELAADVVDSAPGDDDAPTPLRTVARSERPAFKVDPLGNHAEQALRLGFELGCDLFLLLDATQVTESGVPNDVLKRFPEQLPIRLDAAFHKHYDPQYLPASLQLVLSFDALYTCVFPWSAIKQVAIIPLPHADVPAPPPEPVAPTTTKKRPGHLRLIE